MCWSMFLTILFFALENFLFLYLTPYSMQESDPVTSSIEYLCTTAGMSESFLGAY